MLIGDIIIKKNQLIMDENDLEEACIFSTREHVNGLSLSL
jgi:hypothetical protein